MSVEEKRKESLCFNNVTVKNTFRTLKKKLKKLGVNDEDVFLLIDDGLETLKVMKKQGEHMEARLWDYVRAIESLSFKRVRKKKKQG